MYQSDLKINRKNAVIDLTLNGHTHKVIVPFLPLTMFKECILVFGRLFEKVGNRSVALSFFRDYDVLAEFACNEIYEGVQDSEIKSAELKNKFDNFLIKSFESAIILDAENDYQETSFKQFTEKYQDYPEELESALDNAQGFFVFFLVLSRYAGQEAMKGFQHSFTSSSAMEWRESFMKSLSAETTLKTAQ